MDIKVTSMRGIKSTIPRNNLGDSEGMIVVGRGRRVMDIEEDMCHDEHWV